MRPAGKHIRDRLEASEQIYMICTVKMEVSANDD